MRGLLSRSAPSRAVCAAMRHPVASRYLAPANVVCVGVDWCGQMAVLSRRRHTNVVGTAMPPFGVASPSGPKLCQVFELCDSDLLSLVDRAGGQLSESVAKGIFRQVVAGLLHCHAHGVWHMDVKPDNILLQDQRAVLADFGAAVTEPVTTSPCGTLEYACPEALASQQAAGAAAASSIAADKADVWALGVTMFATIIGFFPWLAARHSDAVYAAWSAAWPAAPQCVVASGSGGAAAGADARDGGSGMPFREAAQLMRAGCGRVATEALLDLLVRMLDPNPVTRIPMTDVAVHPWFAQSS